MGSKIDVSSLLGKVDMVNDQLNILLQDATDLCRRINPEVHRTGVSGGSAETGIMGELSKALSTIYLAQVEVRYIREQLGLFYKP